MTLEDAILWAERDMNIVFPNSKSITDLVYYVIPWNDEFVVAPCSYIKRHPNIEYVYNTKTKVINIKVLKWTRK